MTPKDAAESEPLEELQDPPSSETSNEKVTPTSPSDAESLWKQLKPFVARELQSQKDTRIGKLESTVKAFEPVLARVKDLIPADKFQALQRDLEFEDLKARVYGTETETESSAPVVGKQTDNATREVERVVDSVLELPANDPRVTKLKETFGNDPAAYLREGLKLYATISAAQEESTPGEQPPAPRGGAAPRSENPIANIDDPKTLYRMAAKQMAASTGRKRRVPS